MIWSIPWILHGRFWRIRRSARLFYQMLLMSDASTARDVSMDPVCRTDVLLKQGEETYLMRDFSKLDDLLKRFVEQGTNPGCAVAIMQGDELIYHGEAGYADIESGRKVDVHSMFSQASTTKLFT